jgi:hypothetical protein
MFRAHVLIIRRSQLHYTASRIITPIGCDDTRGCVMQFWPPDDEHMCSKHAEAWNKLIVKQKFCASSWLNTEINFKRMFQSGRKIYTLLRYKGQAIIFGLTEIIVPLFEKGRSPKYKNLLHTYLFILLNCTISGTNFYLCPAFSHELFCFGECTVSMLWPINVPQLGGYISHLVASHKYSHSLTRYRHHELQKNAWKWHVVMKPLIDPLM